MPAAKKDTPEPEVHIIEFGAHGEDGVPFEIEVGSRTYERLRDQGLIPRHPSDPEDDE